MLVDLQIVMVVVVMAMVVSYRIQLKSPLLVDLHAHEVLEAGVLETRESLMVMVMVVS